MKRRANGPGYLRDPRTLNRLVYDSSPTAKAVFSCIGSPADCQASHPPISARARIHPARLSSRATRALVASSGQAQKATTHVCRGTFSSVMRRTASSGGILNAPRA
jgi:hypothetical protein